MSHGGRGAASGYVVVGDEGQMNGKGSRTIWGVVGDAVLSEVRWFEVAILESRAP